MKFGLHVRIPGWSEGTAIPGGLYRFRDSSASGFTLTLNGRTIPYNIDKGYLVIEREWKKGDRISIDFPMPVRRIESRPEIGADQSRVALQRGPLVYCVEGADNDNKAWNILLPSNTSFTIAQSDIANEPVVVIEAEVPVFSVSGDGTTIKSDKKRIRAIPYYTWSNRTPDEMQVWIPEKITDLKINR
jgi:hypothetical protein